VLTVECDQHPQEARMKLEQILGPATIIVRSGGKWSNGNGQSEDKLHLHWRLTSPVIDREGLRKLKRARDIAARLVGGDPTGKSIVHPFRWPGSWHRKGEPILCRIETVDPDREIDLDAALPALIAAAPAEQQSDPKSEKPEPGSNDWGDLVRGIVSGETYHPAIIPLSAKLVTAGLNEGAAVNLIRALMHNSAGPRDGRWESRYAKIPDDVDSAQGKFGKDYSSAETKEPEPTPFIFIDMKEWRLDNVPPREWAVFERIPVRQAHLFTGEGAAGKSIVQLHQCFAHVLGRDWLGTMPEPGPAFFIDAEDDDKELHRRAAAVLSHYQVGFAEAVQNGLYLRSLAGEDAVLASTTKGGIVQPTALYKGLLERAGDLKPKMIGIASSANVFAGNENIRPEVQQFIGLLTRMAMAANGAVSLIAHPSLTGINTDSGISGSTQWHNSVRSRMWLKGIKAEAGEQQDSDLRELVFKKNNYGPISESLVLRYDQGLFLPVPGVASLDRAAREAKADEAFIDILRRFKAENRNASDKPGSSYAPAFFIGEEEAKKAGVNGKMLKDAMVRLFRAGKIWNEPYGRPSRPSYRLAIKS